MDPVSRGGASAAGAPPPGDGPTTGSGSRARAKLFSRPVEELWELSGLGQFQVVRCVVTGHRGRFGVEASVIEPASEVAAFIDFIMLGEGGTAVTEPDYPPIGTVLEALTIDFAPPNDELRLSVRSYEVADGVTPP